MTGQMKALFDPAVFEKNGGAGLPVLAVGPDWLDLVAFLNSLLKGRFRILNSAENAHPDFEFCRKRRTPAGLGALPGF